MASLRYWIWLSAAVGARAAREVLSVFGSAEKAFFARREDYDLVYGLSEKAKLSLLNKSLDSAASILNRCEELNVRILTQGDSGYPERLLSIYDPPCVLYIKGKVFDFDSEPAIGVVGSRKASAYGLKCSETLSYQLARCGGLVISGLASGIDAAAHTGALRAGAPTVAVLGCGVDVVYPAENRRLFSDIESAGCLISEYPPGSAALASNFPVRNRIISGLSLGVLVVEAPKKSGSLITSALALEQGRDVYAVSGNIDAECCAGSNALIQDGANLVTCGWDIMREYEQLYPQKITAFASNTPRVDKTEQIMPKTAIKLETADKKEIDNSPDRRYIDLEDLTDDEKLVAGAIGNKRRHIDDIIELSQVPAPRVLSALTMLEIKGAIRPLSNKRYELCLDLTERNVP